MNKASSHRMIWKWMNYTIPKLAKFKSNHNRLFYSIYSTVYFVKNFVIPQLRNDENKNELINYMEIHRRLMVTNYSIRELIDDRNQIGIRSANIFDYDLMELNDLIDDISKSRYKSNKNDKVYRSTFLKYTYCIYFLASSRIDR